MQERYRATILAIDPKTKFMILRRLRIPCLRSQCLYEALGNHDQASLVLCLLQLNTPVMLRYAEKLIGKKITYCPPVRRWNAISVLPRYMAGDQRRIVYVTKEPLLKSGRKPWTRMWCRIRPGLSITQLKERGVSRQSLRLYEKRGWIRLEGSEEARPSRAPRAAA